MQTENERFFFRFSLLFELWKIEGKFRFRFSNFRSLNIHHDAMGIKQKAERKKAIELNLSMIKPIAG
jgi:hypothetical protein